MHINVANHVIFRGAPKEEFGIFREGAARLVDLGMERLALAHQRLDDFGAGLVSAFDQSLQPVIRDECATFNKGDIFGVGQAKTAIS